MHIILPLPPSLNMCYPTHPKTGRKYHSKEYKEWLKRCPELPPAMLEKFHIKYDIYFPDERVRDSKNFLKVIDDYLVSQKVIQDDRWTYMLHEEICPKLDRNNPRIEIFLKSV